MNNSPAHRAAALAAEMLESLSSARQIELPPPTESLNLEDAYAVTAELRRLRAARGEKPVGRKIGFTNRTIWSEYNVYAPIWGDMFATTVHDIADFAGGFPINSFMEPRIEPEIVFGLAAAPRDDMDVAALMDCVGWIAHGFEIVQSPFPGWRFTAADCVVGAGLHGALLLGARQPIAADASADWTRRLADFEIELSCDGAPVDTGTAANVLDGPLHALRHLVQLLADDPHNPPLSAGEIITTGTVTRAFPIAPGERWSTRLIGLPLPGLDVGFV